MGGYVRECLRKKIVLIHFYMYEFLRRCDHRETIPGKVILMQLLKVIAILRQITPMSVMLPTKFKTKNFSSIQVAKVFLLLKTCRKADMFNLFQFLPHS